MPLENILLLISGLMLLSVVASKLSDRVAIPTLLLFLAIGILAGSEGVGGIYFNDPWLAKSVGIIALIFIIFSGGIDTSWKEIKPILIPGILLSTVGVLLTAVIIGFFAALVLRLTFLQGFLLGSIISSTDAAAVFSVLKSKHISLKNPLKPLLELESGSNDPMAVFLTFSATHLLSTKTINIFSLIPNFVIDMGGGALVGYLMAKFVLVTLRHLKLEYEGLYPVLTISLVLLTYSLAAILRCNGFLAVYIVGLLMSKNDFLNKRTIIRFHDGLAWLMQITMFLTLGLLVFPSHILPVMGTSLLLALILMLIARPLSVFICLFPVKLSFAKKAMVSWVGLRGAVPIVLATFPLLAGIPQAETIFNTVFFVVITSVLIRGTSIPLISRLLRVDAPFVNKKHYPIEFERAEGMDAELTDVLVPYDSAAAGKRIIDLNVPEKCLIMLISRQDKFIIPAGPTVIDSGDVLLVLANKEDLAALQKTLTKIEMPG